MLLRLIVTLLFDVLGTAATLPIFPFFISDELAATPSQLGHLFAVYCFGQIFGAVFFGHLSDIYGRKPILLLQFLSDGAGYWLLASASGVRQAAGFRFLAGASGGTFPLLQAFICDLSADPEVRATLFGLVASLMSAKYIIGPFAGAVVLRAVGADRRKALRLCGALCWLSAFIGFWILPEPQRLRVEGAEGREEKKRGWWGLSFEWSKAERKVVVARVGICVATWAVNSLYTVFLRLNWERSAWKEFKIPLISSDGSPDEFYSFVLILSGIVLLLCQSFLYPVLERRLNPGGTLALGAMLLGLGLICIPNSIHSTRSHLVAVTGLYAGGLALCEPALPNLMANVDSKGAGAGVKQGVLSSVRAVASVVAPTLHGHLFEISPGANFTAGAAAAFLAATIALRTELGPTGRGRGGDGSPPRTPETRGRGGRKGKLLTVQSAARSRSASYYSVVEET